MTHGRAGFQRAPPVTELCAPGAPSGRAQSDHEVIMIRRAARGPLTEDTTGEGPLFLGGISGSPTVRPDG